MRVVLASTTVSTDGSEINFPQILTRFLSYPLKSDMDGTLTDYATEPNL